MGPLNFSIKSLLSPTACCLDKKATSSPKGMLSSRAAKTAAHKARPRLTKYQLGNSKNSSFNKGKLLDKKFDSAYLISFPLYTNTEYPYFFIKLYCIEKAAIGDRIGR